MKTTRRIALAKKLGVAPTALAARVGMDAADAATLAKWNLVMDAEEESDEGDGDGGGSDPTLGEIAEMLTDVAPAMSAINEAAAAMAGGAPMAPEPDGQLDDMEPMMDAAGQPMIDPATGKPKMKKKAPPAAGAPAQPVADATPALAACDSAIRAGEATSARAHKALKGRAAPTALIAFDQSIVKARATLNRAVAANRSRPGAALDARFIALENTIRTAMDGSSMRNAFVEITKRDSLAKRLSPFIGVFDASEMTESDVAKYAAPKLGLKAPVGAELAYVEGYLHNRPVGSPRSASSFGLDAAVGSDKSVSDYLSGRAA